MNALLSPWVSQFLVKGQVAVLLYFLAVNGWYLILLVSSLLELRRHMLLIADESRHLLLSSTLSPTISILAPAYNEEATIETSLRALLALQYPNLEVIVVSDGSKDRTVQVLVEKFDLVPVKTIYEQRIKTKPVRALYRSSSYPSLVVVEHRANRQVLLQIFERLFHGDELNVVLPQQGGIIFGEVSA